jgi:hypothetical protein
MGIEPIFPISQIGTLTFKLYLIKKFSFGGMVDAMGLKLIS